MEIQGEEDGSDTIWGELLGASGTSQLPGDLMIQIVSRLPVKSILRFKSVCRAWYFLFNHPNFIQHHSRIANSFAKMNNLFSFVVRTGKNDGDYHDWDYYILSLLLDHLGAEPVFIDPNPPFEGELDWFEVLGSVNGLVCLDLDNQGVTSIVLWNPATRKHSHIPNPQLSLVSGESDTVLRGFAYDHKTNVYKVVRVLFLRSSEVAATVRVEIYNTGTNTWRTTEIVSFPVNRGWSRSGALVGGGTLYWFLPCGELGFQHVILSFDASSEAFRFHFIAPGDKKLYPSDWYQWSLEAMGEHPALIHYEDTDEYTLRIARINIGKLNKCHDGGKDDSFHIEKLTIKPLLDLETVFRICGNGKIIAQDLDGKVLFYDREETKYLPRELWSGYSWFYDYTESLVWPSRLA